MAFFELSRSNRSCPLNLIANGWSLKSLPAIDSRYSWFLHSILGQRTTLLVTHFFLGHESYLVINHAQNSH